MKKESDLHRQIREDLLDKLGDICGRGDIEEYYWSHDVAGDIRFYNHACEKRIFLAQPDIVVIDKNGRVLVIGIELTNTPKHLFGVVSTINSSSIGKFSRKNIDLSSKSMLLVLNFDDIPKKGSCKQTQIDSLRCLIEESTDFEFFDIISDTEAIDKIYCWLGDENDVVEI
ncbi:MAG TPA: hypothetical protein VKL21_03325 [Candidatus Methanoperedens sp.]|nr:hypothetical protein [Candidatus Methanoperedens sp.]